MKTPRRTWRVVVFAWRVMLALYQSEERDASLPPRLNDD